MRDETGQSVSESKGTTYVFDGALHAEGDESSSPYRIQTIIMDVVIMAVNSHVVTEWTEISSVFGAKVRALETHGSTFYVPGPNRP